MSSPRTSKNTLVTPFHLVGNGVAAAANSVTTPASAGLTTYITDIHIALGVAAAIETATLTISNVLGSGCSWRLEEQTAATAFFAFHWADGLLASAANTAMTIALGAVASGGTTDIDVFGYQQ